MDTPLNQWFAEHVLVHEAEIMRYLARAWPFKDDLLDLRQECYVKVYESALRCRPENPRAFLYTALRNLIIDRARRNKTASLDPAQDLDELKFDRAGADPSDRADSWMELKRLRDGLTALPQRCRAAVWLHKVDGLTYAEVAHRQGVSVKTIEKQISRGLRQLADHGLAHAGASGRHPEYPAAIARKEYGNG